jgi:hypothetical protein
MRGASAPSTGVVDGADLAIERVFLVEGKRPTVDDKWILFTERQRANS